MVVNSVKQFGEVFTEKSLVYKMVETLPVETWSNPYIKILDPACGNGIFSTVLIEKFMEGLKDFEPNFKLRYKHIVENILYVCEIQEKNVKIYKSIFDKFNEFSLNVYYTDFLEKDFTQKFDIIVGNPPYNGINIGDRSSGGRNILWDKFVKKSLTLLVKNGFLCFVHPAGWRKPVSKNSFNTGMWRLMTIDNQMHYLEIHNCKDGKQTFNAITRYDFYCIEKTPQYTNIIVKDELGDINTINPTDWEFLPNYNFESVKKLLKFDSTGIDVIVDSSYHTIMKWVSNTQDEIYRYKIVHTTPKGGTRYKYSSTCDKGHFGIPKVIFGDSGIYDVVIDIAGEFGMTQDAIGLKIDSETDVEKLKSFLMSEYFKDILKSCSWSNFRIDCNLFKYFKNNFYNTNF